MAEYLTLQDVADRLKVSRTTVARMCRDGILTTERSPVDKRVMLVKAEQVERLARLPMPRQIKQKKSA